MEEEKYGIPERWDTCTCCRVEFKNQTHWQRLAERGRFIAEIELTVEPNDPEQQTDCGKLRLIITEKPRD
jgi:hypothetical protein